MQNQLIQLFHCTNPGLKAGKSETSLLELPNSVGKSGCSTALRTVRTSISISNAKGVLYKPKELENR